jgi:hypothetical protein
MALSNAALAWYQHGLGRAGAKLVSGIVVAVVLSGWMEILYRRSHRRDHERAGTSWPCA